MVGAAYKKFWRMTPLLLLFALLATILEGVMRLAGGSLFDWEALGFAGIAIFLLMLMGPMIIIVRFLWEVGQFRKALKKMPRDVLEQVEMDFLKNDHVGDAYFTRSHLVIIQCFPPRIFSFACVPYHEIEAIKYKESVTKGNAEMFVWARGDKLHISRMELVGKNQEQDIAEIRRRVDDWNAGNENVRLVSKEDSYVQKQEQADARWGRFTHTPAGSILGSLFILLFFLVALMWCLNLPSSRMYHYVPLLTRRAGMLAVGWPILFMAFQKAKSKSHPLYWGLSLLVGFASALFMGFFGSFFR